MPTASGNFDQRIIVIDLTTVLNAAVRQGFITVTQAETLRPKMNAFGMPAETLATDIPDTVWPAILFELYGLSNGPSSSPDINEARARIAAMKIADLLKVHERLQDNFERKNWMLAVGLLGGNSLESWQQAFWESVVFLLLAQFVLGSGGRVPSTLQKARLEAKLRREAEYLRRFALAIAIGLAGATGPRVPSTEAAITSRANIYSGTPRGEFYEALEERLEELTNEEVGWVMEYIPKDDDSTCNPCSNAAGYYLPGSGPRPGSVCEGRGRCRCRRVPRFLPEIYAKLHTSNL